MSGTLLSAEGLRKVFPRSSARDGGAAVDGASLALSEGDFAVVTGPSGSGKTTLLTMLAGLATPTEGRVLFRGRDLAAMSDAEISGVRNAEICFVPQGAGLLGSLTVLDNVRAPMMFSSVRRNPDRAAFLLESMGLLHLADEWPRNLSGGETRRVAIARALFCEPSLLLADEPTSDLDPENSRLVMDLLAQANGLGTALLVVTHSADVAACGRRRLSMERGRLLEA